VSTPYDIAIIGGGAAGFFAAIHAADAGRNRVVILEKTSKLLTKVGVSGGGRCNVTHDCPYPNQLVQFYPRGGKRLRKAFEKFNTVHTRSWFENRGVALKTEADGRVFPVSNNSQTIIDCLMVEAGQSGIAIRLKSDVQRISPEEKGGFSLSLQGGESILCHKVIVTAGGFNKPEGYDWITRLGLHIANPVPSLFTFNVPDSDMKDLMGLSVPRGFVQIPGSKWKEDGPVLITHWGFSAPAVIKLSSRAAIDLHSRQYAFPILINWTGEGEDTVRQKLMDMRENNPSKRVSANPGFDIPTRLWERLCGKAEIPAELRHADLPAKKANKLIEILIRCAYEVNGKTTFKEEFVTCGGVLLDEVDLTTFESKKIPGLYFAGEVLDVDGVTGGYNFQHAWTSGFLAGSYAAQSVRADTALKPI